MRQYAWLRAAPYSIMLSICLLFIPSVRSAPAPLTSPIVAIQSQITGEIAYEQGGNIWLLNVATGQAKQLTSDGTNATPSWSPDGQWITFASDRAGSSAIYRMRANGTELTRITKSALNEKAPSYSPQGTLYFVRTLHDSGTEFDYDVVIKRSSLGQETIVYDEAGAPLCQVEGVSARTDDAVIVNRGCGGGPSVFLLDTRTGHILWTEDCGYSGRTNHAGSLLAFVYVAGVCSTENSLTLFTRTFNANNPQKKPIFFSNDNSFGIGSLSWSPDDNWLVFDESNAGLWVIGAQGGQPQQISSVGSHPAWRPRKAWTLMYYLAGDSNLSHVLRDYRDRLKEFAGSPYFNIAILYDGEQQGDSQYCAVSENVLCASRQELNTGEPATLIDFVDWARENLPSTDTALTIAGHGNGVSGAAFDESSIGGCLGEIKDCLSIKELGTAFAQIFAHHGKVNVLFMDSCLMGTIDSAYQLRGFVDYYVASENLAYVGFERFDTSNFMYLKGITPNLDPKTLALSIENNYGRIFGSEGGLAETISVAQLSRLPDFVAKLNSLSLLLKQNMSGIGTLLMRDKITRQVQRFDSFPPDGINLLDELIDLYDFARLVKDNVDNQATKNAAQAVMDVIQDDSNPTNRYILDSFPHSGKATNKVEYQLDRSHGVSAFFPNNIRSFYNPDNLDFAAGTDWGHPATMFSQPTAAPSVLAPVEWGPMLVEYVRATNPNAPDDPNPPPLVAPLPPIGKVYLPLVGRTNSSTAPGTSDLTVSALREQRSAAGRITGLNVTILNHNSFGGPTLPVPPAPDGTGSFFVDLFVFGPNEAVVTPILPLSDSDTQGSKAYANVLKRVMGVDATYTITQWCDSNAPTAACQPLDLSSLFPVSGTYTVIAAVDSYGYVNEGTRGGEKNNLTQVTFTVNAGPSHESVQPCFNSGLDVCRLVDAHAPDLLANRAERAHAQHDLF